MTPKDSGIVQVYTGNGKGKTTAALGQALRACGWGWQVVIIQFMKDGHTSGEVAASLHLENLRFECFGSGRFVKRGHPEPEDLRLASAGMARAEEILKQGKCDMLVLDEINTAVDFGLVDEAELLRLIDLRPQAINLVLTGRNARLSVIDKADLVTEMLAIKHPFDTGQKARKGIEY